MSKLEQGGYGMIARQFLRAIRAHRSQVAFSRKLGFSSNVAAEWESGRRIPRVTTALSACRHFGVDVGAAMQQFSPQSATLLVDMKASTLSRWLDAQRGEEPVSAIARRAELSRHQVSRILGGATEPRLQQFFALIHACTGRLSDLIADCVDIQQIPELTTYHNRVTISRRLAFEEPWTSAILAALECMPDLDRDQVESVLERTLELSLSEVRRYLRHLVQAGVVARRNRRYVLSEPLVVDTGTSSEAARRLTQHWAKLGVQRALTKRKGDVFSFNVFSVSREDLARIAQLQREHFHRVRGIVAKSTPETVAVMNLQLLEFEPGDE